jgi:hypothetical protein
VPLFCHCIRARRGSGKRPSLCGWVHGRLERGEGFPLHRGQPRGLPLYLHRQNFTQTFFCNHNVGVENFQPLQVPTTPSPSFKMGKSLQKQRLLFLETSNLAGKQKRTNRIIRRSIINVPNSLFAIRNRNKRRYPA